MSNSIDSGIATSARRIATGAQGSIAIGFTAAFGYGFLPDMVRRLRRRAADTALTLKAMVTSEQLEALDAGQLDGGLMRPHARHGGLETVELGREALMLAVPANEAKRWPAPPTVACCPPRRAPAPLAGPGYITTRSVNSQEETHMNPRRDRPAALQLVATMLLWSAAHGAAAQLPNLNDVVKGSGLPRVPGVNVPSGGHDDATSASGIREALAVGTERAVTDLARPDGYFGNAAVRILMPSDIQRIADVARMAGFQQQVDDFILSMNRAAEAAVPIAARYFGDAIRELTLDDARAIVTGGDTAATEFFQRRTRPSLYAAFKPVVVQKMGEAGTAGAYRELMGRAQSLPLLGRQNVDLEDYVTNKALDGLFYMVGQEERRIRTNPAARSTDLLKTVFGR